MPIPILLSPKMIYLFGAQIVMKLYAPEVFIRLIPFYYIYLFYHIPTIGDTHVRPYMLDVTIETRVCVRAYARAYPLSILSVLPILLDALTVHGWSVIRPH